MAQSIADIVRRLSVGPEGMDVQEVQTLLHEGYTHHITGSHQLAGTYRAGNVADLHRRFRELPGGHSAETYDVLVGDAFGAFLRHARTGGGGAAREYDYLVLVRIQDGRLAESWNFYLDEERTRAALGAS